jgi:hypothetical protein
MSDACYPSVLPTSLCSDSRTRRLLKHVSSSTLCTADIKKERKLKRTEPYAKEIMRRLRPYATSSTNRTEQNIRKSYFSPTIYYDAVYLLPATYAKAVIPKHEYYGQEGNIYFPNLPNPMQMRSCEGSDPTQRQVQIVQTKHR